MSLFNRWTMALARAVPRIGLAAALMTSGLTAFGQTANPTPYSYTLVTNYTYRTDAPYAGLLATKTVQPSDATLCSVTSYGYDSTGNLSQTTVANCTSPAPPAASAFTARSSGAAYGAVSSQTITVAGAAKPVSIPAGLVMTAATNALGQQETHQFDPRFGTMLQRTDVDKLNTSWAVDDFGRTIREVRPDKTSVITRYCILNGLGLDTSSNSPNCSTPTAGEIPPDAYMFTESEEHDVNDQKISGISRAYLDRLGRTIRTTSQAYDGAKQGATAGTLIVADTVYSAYGTKLLQSDPYFLASGSSSVTGSNDAGATLYTYDALGRVSAVYTTDPSGLAGSINFARAGSAAGYANYGMRTARAALTSVAGLVTTLTNDKGLQRIEERDPQGQLLRVTDENSAQVSYEYDAFGHTTVTQDALGNQIAAAYDIAGDLLSTTDPDKGATTFTYDPLGEPLSSQNADELAWGTRTSMSYDPLGRMTQRSAREYTATWTYDSCPNGVGRVCAVSTTAGLNKSFAYDNLGRLVGKRLWTSAVSLPEAFSFDNLTGRLAGQTYPTGLQVAYSYSALGYPSAMTLVTPATVNPLPATQGGTAGNSASLPGQSLLWSNDVVNAFGATVQQTYGNGVVATAGFQPGSDRLVGLAANGPAGPVTNQAYGWDSLGNLSSRSESAPGPSALSETFQYGNPAWHDNLNRLTSYTVADPDMPGLSRTVSLAYNALGLLLAKSDVGSYTYNTSGNGAAQPHALQSVAGAQNVSFSYDARGNVTGGSNGKFSTIAYTSFDLPDNQTGVSGSAAQPSYTWSYDENHARVQEIRRNLSSDGVHYDLRTTWYDQPDNVGGLGFEYEVNAPAAADQGQIAPVNENRHFLTAGGRVIGVLVSEGVLDTAATAPPAITGIVLRKVEYWHQDHLGSLIATTDHTGAVTARYAYDPFGKRRFTTGAYDASGSLVVDWSTQLNNGTARGFTGHEHLDDIGLIQMNGRLFDPTLGVFLQADPSVPHPQSLQSFQRYAYCEGNPLNCTDPNGFEDVQKIEITAPHDDNLMCYNYPGFLAVTAGAIRTISNATKTAHRSVSDYVGSVHERYSHALEDALFSVQGYIPGASAQNPQPTPLQKFLAVLQMTGPQGTISVGQLEQISKLLGTLGVTTNQGIPYDYLANQDACRSADCKYDAILTMALYALGGVGAELGAVGGAGDGALIGGGDASAAGPNGASLPLGSKRLQFNQPESPWYQPIRNDPTTIGETDYSGHAIDRMQDRGVMPSVVQNTIDTGVATPSRMGTTVYYDPVNNVSVVTNAQGKVVTVKYGR
jgi:RHS repeat-associated protein